MFRKKTKYPLSDILKGIQYAINSVQDMLHAQQVQNLLKFWQKEDGSPVTQNIPIGERELEVPLMSLVPHSHLEMDNVEIKFKAKIGDVEHQSISNKQGDNEGLSLANLKMEVDGIKARDDDVMEITIHFKAKETPEGVARLTDEYNKHI